MKLHSYLQGVHIVNPGTQQAEVDLCEFKANLDSTESSRKARVTWDNTELMQQLQHEEEARQNTHNQTGTIYSTSQYFLPKRTILKSKSLDLSVIYQLYTTGQV